MSYGFIGTFVDVKNKRVIATADLDRLKSLNLRSYACDLKDIMPTGTAKDEDYPDITTYVSYEYVGYYKPRILENVLGFTPYRKKEWNTTKNAYYLPEDVIDINASLLEKYELNPTIEEIKTLDENGDNIIILYSRRVKRNNGQWYRQDDFLNVEEKITNEYFKKRDDLNDLKKFRNTKEYFEMSEDGKNSYLSEVEYLEESLDEYKYEYEAVEYILHVFEFLMDDMANVSTDNFGEKKYEWSYDDKREIELYIEVC